MTSEEADRVSAQIEVLRNVAAAIVVLKQSTDRLLIVLSDILAEQRKQTVILQATEKKAK